MSGPVVVLTLDLTFLLSVDIHDSDRSSWLPISTGLEPSSD